MKPLRRIRASKRLKEALDKMEWMHVITPDESKFEQQYGEIIATIHDAFGVTSDEAAGFPTLDDFGSVGPYGWVLHDEQRFGNRLDEAIEMLKWMIQQVGESGGREGAVAAQSPSSGEKKAETSLVHEADTEAADTIDNGIVSDARAVKAFISYSHKDREFGHQAKALLREFGIDAFLAHEDLEVSQKWKGRILDELHHCDLFVPILSRNFTESKWAPQEAGFIASRPKVVIAPISIDGTTPFGFFEDVHGPRIGNDGITRELLVDPVLEPLAELFPRRVLPGLITVAGQANRFRDAERKMRPLVPLFVRFNAEEAQALAEASVENYQIWRADRCRTEFLPEFIRVHASNIEPYTLRALQHQIENDERYIPSPAELSQRME